GLLVGLLVGPYRRLRAGPMERLEARMHAREHAVEETHGWWRRVGEAVARRPRVIGAGGLALLVVMALGLLNFTTGLTQSNQFRDTVQSVEGQALIEQSFPPGQAAPTDVVLSDPAAVPAVVEAARGVPGVAAVSEEPVAGDDEDVQLAVYLDKDPYSEDAFAIVPDLREAVRAAAPGALV